MTTAKNETKGERTGITGPLRAGIAGAGLMGHWHAYALTRSGGQLCAVADFDLKKADLLTSKYSSASTFSSTEEMLSSGGIDVLHICTPTESHESIAESAIERGIHLIVEKPLAESADSTKHLYDLASKNGTLICPVHQFPFQEGVTKALKDFINVGQVLHIEALICSAGAVAVDDEHATMIAADVLPHPLSLIQAFTHCDISRIEWSMSVPQPGELRMNGMTENKITISIVISMNSRPTANSIRFFGTKRTIYADLFHGFSFIEPGKTSKFRKLIHPFDLGIRQFSSATGNLVRRGLSREPAYPGLRRLIRDFYRAVQGTRDVPISAKEVIEIAKVRDRMLKQIC